MFTPNNFVLRKDRNGRRFGVAILIRNDLVYTALDDCVPIEYVCCKVKVGTNSFTEVYRQPGLNIFVPRYFESYMLQKFNADSKLIITSFFKLSGISW